MKIEYKITEYFNNNNLFDSENTERTMRGIAHRDITRKHESYLLYV